MSASRYSVVAGLSSPIPQVFSDRGFTEARYGFIGGSMTGQILAQVLRATTKRMYAMVDWDHLFDEAALASVLPGELTRFARPVRDALAVFLSGLPETHQLAILNDQTDLGISASISERLGTLARSCPVLHKLGQILARDQRLSPDLRHQLRELESLPPSVPLQVIEEGLEAELGSLDAIGIRLMPPALAEASVAVVIPFECDEPWNGGTLRQGVFKILKPGIEERLSQELALMEDVGSHLDERCDELNIPHLDYRESFEQVRDKLLFEVRLEQEQRNLAHARRFFESEPQVKIPAVFPHCTSRVTAMERVFGHKVTEHRLESETEKCRLADLVSRALIAKPIFSPVGRSLIHCDPHAGNLFLTSHGSLAILDWSLVAEFEESERVAIVQIVLGALTLDARRIETILTGLAERQDVDGAALKKVVGAWLGRVRKGQFPGLGWLVGMLDEAVLSARLRVGSNMMLFRKTLHTLEGVVAEIGADGFQIDDVMCREFLRQFAVEWPRRWLAMPHSREFATRLSNADLTAWMLSAPSTATRFWFGKIRDLLGTPTAGSHPGRVE